VHMQNRPEDCITAHTILSLSTCTTTHHTTPAAPVRRIMAFQIDINTTEAFKQEVLSTPGVLQSKELADEAIQPSTSLPEHLL